MSDNTPQGASQSQPKNPKVVNKVLDKARKKAAQDSGYNSQATRELLTKKLKDASGLTAYDWQLDVAEALHLGKDCVVIAGTGAGKTTPFVMPLFLDETDNKMILIISPLNELQRDQATRFRAMGLTATPVNSESYSTKLHTDIEKRAYKMLLTSPEMVLEHPRFSKLMRTPAFTNDIKAIVIDEAHCIQQWGKDFRTEYDQLAKLRSFVPLNIPLLVTSATLPPPVLASIQMKLTLYSESTFLVNLGNDRHNITPLISRMRGAAGDLDALNFALDGYESGALTRSLIFFNTRDLTFKGYRHLKSQLPPEMQDKINYLTAGRTPRARRRIMKDYRAGKIEILCATEAAGMGMDMGDIDQVIQFMVPSSLAIWLQRYGRAGRRGQPSIVVLLVEPSVYKKQKKRKKKKGDTKGKRKQDQEPEAGSSKLRPLTIDEQDESDNDARSDGDERLDDGAGSDGADDSKDADDPKAADKEVDDKSQHELEGGDGDSDDEREYSKNLEEGMRNWIEAITCRREVANKYFGNPESVTKNFKLTVPCCDNCLKQKSADPSNILTDAEQAILALMKRIESRNEPTRDDDLVNSNGKRPANGKAEKKPHERKGELLDRCTDALYDWRESCWESEHNTANWGPEELLRDADLKKLARLDEIATIEDIRTQVPGWDWVDDYGEDILDILVMTDRVWVEDNRVKLAAEQETKEEVSRQKLKARRERANKKRKEKRAAERAIKEEQDKLEADRDALAQAQQDAYAQAQHAACAQAQNIAVRPRPRPRPLHRENEHAVAGPSNSQATRPPLAPSASHPVRNQSHPPMAALIDPTMDQLPQQFEFQLDIRSPSAQRQPPPMGALLPPESLQSSFRVHVPSPPVQPDQPPMARLLPPEAMQSPPSRSRQEWTYPQHPHPHAFAYPQHPHASAYPQHPQHPHAHAYAYTQHPRQHPHEYPQHAHQTYPAYAQPPLPPPSQDNENMDYDAISLDVKREMLQD